MFACVFAVVRGKNYDCILEFFMSDERIDDPTYTIIDQLYLPEVQGQESTQSIFPIVLARSKRARIRNPEWNELE